MDISKATFETWDQANLAQFAYECKSEINRLRDERNRLHDQVVLTNNQYAHVLQVLSELMKSYRYFLDISNHTPEKQRAYMDAVSIFE